MKRKLVSLAITGAIVAAPAVMAVEGPVVYGKVSLSVGQVKVEDENGTVTDNYQVRSHASRLGFKGEHDLGNGLAATYKLEYEVNPDSDNKETITGETGAAVDNTDVDSISDSGTAGFARRNQYIGLKGGFGEVRFGRHDTPLKMAQGKFDQFNDTDADLKYATKQDGEHRFDNVLAYLGKTGNVKYAIALVPGEGDGEKTVDGGTGKGDSLTDNISASVAYQDGPVYVAVAMDQYDDTDGQDENSLMRLVGTYNTGGMQFGLLYQQGVEKATKSDDKAATMGVSFGMKAGSDGKVKAQYIQSEDDADDTLKTKLMAIGYDHKLSKTTTAYVMYSNVKSETDATEDKTTFAGAGMVVKF